PAAPLRQCTLDRDRHRGGDHRRRRPARPVLLNLVPRSRAGGQSGPMRQVWRHSGVSGTAGAATSALSSKHPGGFGTLFEYSALMETTSDFLLQRLSEWGISRIYGYPGDGINGILGALGRAKDRIQLTQVRHEEMAAFMACAH